MYNEVLKLAKSEGVSQVRLYVDKDNLKAQKVYEKSGMSRCHYLMYEVEGGVVCSRPTFTKSEEEKISVSSPYRPDTLLLGHRHGIR